MVKSTQKSNESRITILKNGLIEDCEEMELMFQEDTYQTDLNAVFVNRVRGRARLLLTELEGALITRNTSHIEGILSKLVAICDGALAHLYNKERVEYYEVILGRFRPKLNDFATDSQDLDGL